MTDVSEYDWPHPEPFAFRREPYDIKIKSRHNEDGTIAVTISYICETGKESTEAIRVYNSKE